MIESRVKQIMREKGVTIEALAEQTGLATETIKRARDERIRLCKLETLVNIARSLSVHPCELFTI